MSADPHEEALRALQVAKHFGSVRALNGVSITVYKGECVVLIGESGSGKTTLLRCFNRLIDPDAGEVFVGGRRASELDPVLLRRRVGYVPQDGGLLPHWRVRRNVELVPWLREVPNTRDLAAQALGIVGLDPAVSAIGGRESCRAASDSG
jgi:osmoprotectant transport system ATP-binding protein